LVEAPAEYVEPDETVSAPKSMIEAQQSKTSSEDQAPRERKVHAPRKDEDSAHQDRNSDARGAEDRARKTRRNPHGIAEMDIADNVVAFGGFTPAFLLVDPYGGKGAPPLTLLEDENFDDEAEEKQSASETPPPQEQPSADCAT
jgi:hypothetical protein